MAASSAQTIKKILEGVTVPEMQLVKEWLVSTEAETKNVHSEIIIRKMG